MKKIKSISYRSIHEKDMKDPEFRDLYKKACNRSRIQYTIVELREKKGLTQVELAELMGTKQSNISRWEEGLCDGIRLSTLERIANAFDCNLDVRFVPKKKGVK